jgi:hypothetical protein
MHTGSTSFSQSAFSVKIRMASDENDIEEIIPLLNDFPLSEVIVQPDRHSNV